MATGGSRPQLRAVEARFVAIGGVGPATETVRDLLLCGIGTVRYANPHVFGRGLALNNGSRVVSEPRGTHQIMLERVVEGLRISVPDLAAALRFTEHPGKPVRHPNGELALVGVLTSLAGRPRVANLRKTVARALETGEPVPPVPSSRHSVTL